MKTFDEVSEAKKNGSQKFDDLYDKWYDLTGELVQLFRTLNPSHGNLKKALSGWDDMEAAFTSIPVSEAVAVDSDIELGLVVDKAASKKKGKIVYGVVLDGPRGKKKVSGPKWAKVADKLVSVIGRKIIDADVESNPDIDVIVWFEVITDDKGSYIMYETVKINLPKM